MVFDIFVTTKVPTARPWTYLVKNMRIIFTIFFLLIFSLCNAQTISPDSAKFYVDSSVTVCGTVSVVYQSTINSISLNFGQAPNFSFKGFISEVDAVKIPGANKYLKKKICINGEIKLIYGTPTILITDPKQIRLIDSDPK